MPNYQHLLLAVDFFDHTQMVAQKAKLLADTYQSQLSVVHVVENATLVEPDFCSPLQLGMDFTAALADNAQQKLNALKALLGLADNQVYLEFGRPASEIIRVANEIKADLIVVGSHGRHGLALLLGSTANGVLHHAACDVLAVRLPDD
jgi:universal stress protein A